MRVALVWPNSTFLIDPMWYPPLGLFHLWGSILASGHQADFYDLAVDSLPLRGYDQYWVSGTSPQASELRRIGDLLRGKGLRAVLGGPHAMTRPREMSEHYDLVVTGDCFLSEDIEKCLLWNGVLELPRKETLDALPLPVRLECHRYKATLEGRPCTTMMTSWGCPYRCAFCSSNALYGSVRYVPLGHIEEDLRRIHASGFGAVQFYDDILPLKKDRALAIAARVHQHGLIWRCFMRSDLATRHGREFLTELAIRGLKEILVGVESGSDRIKLNIRKGTTIRQDTLLLAWCRDLGISFKASLILGLPGETMDTLQQTRSWLLENRPDRLDLNVLIPMPGTPIYEQPELFDCSWTCPVPEEAFFKGTPGALPSLVHTSGLTAEQILEFRDSLCQELGIPY